MQVTVTVQGTASLLMHNGQLADPLNPFSLKQSEVSKKRNKSEEDHAFLAENEFHGGLYMTNAKPGTKGFRPTLPPALLEGAIINGAKKHKEGPMAKAAVVVSSVDFIYDGPTDPHELFAEKLANGDKRFVKRTGVRVGQATVMRTRPEFSEWGARFIVDLDDGVAGKTELKRWLDAAGRLVGLGDWRPQHGRFIVEKIEELALKKAA